MASSDSTAKRLVFRYSPKPFSPYKPLSFSMQTLFLTENVSLSMVQDGLKIKNGESTQIVSPPYIPWDAIVIQNGFGYISFPAIRILLSLRVSIAMLDYQGSVLGHMSPYNRRAGEQRLKQLRASDDPEKCLAIAKKIVRRGYNRRGISVNVNKANDVRELLNLESAAAEAYWARWKARLAAGWPQHDFDGRGNPRYRANFRAVTKVNAVLNYSYAILESACRTAIERAGLEPDIGFLHMNRRRSQPLVYDMMELGRGWVDEAVLSWLSKPENQTGFKRLDDWVIRMKPETIRNLIEFVSPRIQTETLWHDSRDLVKTL
jgi:CRISPR-associated protein Cas1